MISKKQFSVFALTSLVCLLFVAAFMVVKDSEAAAVNRWIAPPSDEDPTHLSDQEDISELAEVEEAPTVKAEAEPPTPVPPSNPWANYPNVCETFKVIQSSKRVKTKTGWRYPLNYRRNRYKRSKADQKRTRQLVELVAREMGVKEPKFFAAFALHESTWNPEAIHILNPDREANQRAWKQHSYNRGRELELEAKMRATSAQDKKFWRYKAQLADVRLYKGNTHWNDRLQYDFIIPGRTVREGGKTMEVPKEVITESRSVWGFGYGLYGMYAVGYVHIWDREAPPWILCGDEGIVATVVQVWAARNAVSECDYLTGKNSEKWGEDGGTYEGVVRRLGRGHCSDARLGKAWQRVMKQYDTVPWDEHADFGHKFPRYEMERKRGKWVYKKDAEGKKIPTDREAILAHMLKRAEEEGLLRETPLERKVPDSEPVVLPGRKPVTAQRGSSQHGGKSTASAP